MLLKEKLKFQSKGSLLIYSEREHANLRLSKAHESFGLAPQRQPHVGL